MRLPQDTMTRRFLAAHAVSRPQWLSAPWHRFGQAGHSPIGSAGSGGMRASSRGSASRTRSPTRVSRSDAHLRPYTVVPVSFAKPPAGPSPALVVPGAVAPAALQRLVPSGFFACRPCGFAVQRKIPPSRRPLLACPPAAAAVPSGCCSLRLHVGPSLRCQMNGPTRTL